MQLFEKPDPLFGYDLDTRRWKSLRAEMAGVKNPEDAKIGTDAADAFSVAIDSPPPTTDQVDAILRAVNGRSLTVARNASNWMCVLASLDQDALHRVASAWKSLRTQGRWSILWSMSPKRPHMPELFDRLAKTGLADRSTNIRCWTAIKAQQFGRRELLDLIQTRAREELDLEAQWLFQQSVDLLAQGWSFRADAESPPSGMMYVAAEGEMATGFSVNSDTLRNIRMETLGRIATEAIKNPDPNRFGIFTERLFAGKYSILGEPPSAQ